MWGFEPESLTRMKGAPWDFLPGARPEAAGLRVGHRLRCLEASDRGKGAAKPGEEAGESLPLRHDFSRAAGRITAKPKNVSRWDVTNEEEP